jgi:hypothetical protein
MAFQVMVSGYRYGGRDEVVGSWAAPEENLYETPGLAHRMAARLEQNDLYGSDMWTWVRDTTTNKEHHKPRSYVPDLGEDDILF